MSLGERLIFIASITLLVVAFSPLARNIMLPLENRFPLVKTQDIKGKKVDGIVVLGGTVHMGVSEKRGVPSIVSGAERIIETAILARQFPNARIIAVGGPNTLFSKPAADATVVKKLLIDLGVKGERISTDPSSRNTWQNAINSKTIANPKPGENWLLVTSAYHMARAVGCFRVAKFDISPFPVDYYTGGEMDRFNFFYYAFDGITMTDTAVKEWLGLIAYKLTDRSTSFFPKPD